MATRKILFISMVSLFVVFTSCKEKTPEEPIEPEVSQLSVCVQPVFGGQTLYLDSTYTTAEGYDVRFTDLKFFAEDVRSSQSQLKDASFFDYRETGISLLTAAGSPEDFTSLDWNLGVQSSLNNSDPAAFPNDNVLNISNSGGMHWGWNPGYIFMKVEAKIDTIQDGNPLFDQFVVFHVGKNENLQTLSFSNINWQQTGNVNYVFPLKLDMQKFLQNGSEIIDLKNENSSHTAPGQEALSLKVITNFRDAISEF